MLRHIVFIKFKEDAASADIENLEKGLAGLPALIGEIRSFSFGRDVVRSERSYDLALVGDFDDLDAMNRYQVHPDHQAVVALVKKVASGVVAVDFEL